MSLRLVTIIEATPVAREARLGASWTISTPCLVFEEPKVSSCTFDRARFLCLDGDVRAFHKDEESGSHMAMGHRVDVSGEDIKLPDFFVIETTLGYSSVVL